MRQMKVKSMSNRLDQFWKVLVQNMAMETGYQEAEMSVPWGTEEWAAQVLAFYPEMLMSPWILEGNESIDKRERTLMTSTDNKDSLLQNRQRNVDTTLQQN